MKAIKRDSKGRVALIGPSGSGKSLTSLRLAVLLANGGKIAAIDTEHGSLSKYADLFDFDCDEPDITSVDYFLKQLTEAEKGGYAVFLVDSLSHFWMGPGGALEFVDEKVKASGGRDNFVGWKTFRPHERSMVDRMIASPCHVICTMRTQTEYVEEMNDRGKKVRRKIGLKPIQRDGLEYEFDLVGSMDEDNNLIIDKNRVMLADGTSPYTGRVFAKPSAKDFGPFVDWLKGVKTERPSDVVAKWQARLNVEQVPDIIALTALLPEVKAITDDAARKLVWPLVKQFAASVYCPWDDAKKMFVHDTVPPNTEKDPLTISD